MKSPCLRSPFAQKEGIRILSTCQKSPRSIEVASRLLWGQCLSFRECGKYGRNLYRKSVHISSRIASHYLISKFPHSLPPNTSFFRTGKMPPSSADLDKNDQVRILLQQILVEATLLLLPSCNDTIAEGKHECYPCLRKALALGLLDAHILQWN